NGAGLASDLSCDVACEIIRCAGELFVPECVDEVNALSELAYIASVRQADPFGYGDYDGGLPGQELFYLSPECLDVEGQLGQVDEIRACAVFAFCKGSRAGKPAGIASHDLYDGH